MFEIYIKINVDQYMGNISLYLESMCQDCVCEELLFVFFK